MIKYGFKIKDGRIYDTKIQVYKLSAETIGGNIIYKVTPSNYKRLILFEALLNKYSVSDVFEMLRVNKSLKRNRDKETILLPKTLDYASNMSVSLKYPPTYFNKKKYYLYKMCRVLKNKTE